MTDSPERVAAREEVTLGELGGIVRRRFAWVVAGAALGLLGAGAVLYASALRYEARATLLFQPEGPSAELLSSLEVPLGLGTLMGASATVAGEIEALRARPLVEKVLRERGAPAPEGRCARIDDLARQSAWRALFAPAPEAPPLALEVLEWPFPDDECEGLVLSFLPGGRLRARREGWLGEEEERPYRAGEPLAVLGARLVLRGDAGLEGRSFRLRCPTLARAASEFLEDLGVREDPAGSQAVRVVVPDADAGRAAGIANGLVRAYLDENQLRRRRQAGRPVEFLEDELARVRAELEEAEADLLAFARESGPLALPGAANEVVEKLTEVDLERARQELELHAAELVLARVRSGELSSDELAALEATGVFSHELVEPLIALVARRAELVREYTEIHPDVAQADAAITQRIAAIEGVLDSQRWQLQESAREFERLVQDYLGELDAFPEIQVDLARRRRAVEAFSGVYLAVLGRIEESKVSQGAAVPTADVLEWADVPFEPAGPSLVLHLAVGLALGLGLGLGVSFLREYQLRPLVSVERVESLLGVECVALDSEQASGEGLRTLQALLGRGRGAARALLVVPVGRRARAAGVAAELARAFARSGERVLLVDADLAGGRLHERFRRRQAPGLGEALAEPDEPAGTLQATDEERLTLVARGTGAASVPRAAWSRRMAAWQAQHERVVLAAPAAERSAVAYELADPATALVLVCADAGEDELARVVRRLRRCGAEPVAAVLQS